jgi:hypothetical protein
MRNKADVRRLATRVDAKRGKRELAREPIPRVLEGGYDSIGRGPTAGPHLMAHCRAVLARTDHAACPSYFIRIRRLGATG